MGQSTSFHLMYRRDLTESPTVSMRGAILTDHPKGSGRWLQVCLALYTFGHDCVTDS